MHWATQQTVSNIGFIYFKQKKMLIFWISNEFFYAQIMNVTQEMSRRLVVDIHTYLSIPDVSARNGQLMNHLYTSTIIVIYFFCLPLAMVKLRYTGETSRFLI